MALGELPIYQFTQNADYAINSFSNFYGVNRASDPAEANDGTRLTIDAGFVDPQKQIQDMILAGEKLNSYREFDDEEALTNEQYAIAIAQIRHPNTDITEIQTYTDAVNTKIAEAKSEAERQAARMSLEVGTPAYKNYEEKTPETIPEPPSS